MANMFRDLELNYGRKRKKKKKSAGEQLIYEVQRECGEQRGEREEKKKKR